jgi:hypothetical protein
MMLGRRVSKITSRYGDAEPSSALPRSTTLCAWTQVGARVVIVVAQREACSLATGVAMVKSCI